MTTSGNKASIRKAAEYERSEPMLVVDSLSPGENRLLNYDALKVYLALCGYALKRCHKMRQSFLTAMSDNEGEFR